MDQRELSFSHHHSILQTTTPHDLIVRVGAKGPYQDNIFYLTIVLWYIVGVVIFQTPFLFMEPQFQFPNNQEIDICTIQQNIRRTFYIPHMVNSINTQFGPFICQYLFLLGVLKSIVYFGGLTGYLVFSSFMDNYGRKFALLLTSVCTCVGSVLLLFGQNLYLIGIGLFFIGCGRTVTRVTVMIINQICDESMRQRGSVVLQVFQGLSGFSIVLGYYFIRDWKIFNWITVFIPSLIVLFVVIYYVQQTPTFLLLKQQGQALRALNRIGKINLGIDAAIQKEDIDNFYSMSNLKKRQKQVNFMHLFTLPSLKTKTYGLSIVYIFMSFLYYAPIFIVNQMSMDAFVSMMAFSAVQFVGYVTMVVIQKTPRRLTGFCIFGVSSILTGILIFVKVPQGCEEGDCFQSYLQLFCVFASRLCSTFYFTIVTLYQNEIYPTKARGLGLGFVAAMGAVSTTLVNIIISFCLTFGIDIMIVFTLSGFLAAYGLYYLPQTLNQPLQQEVEQFKYSRLISQNDQAKQMSIINIKPVENTSQKKK